MNKVLCVFKKVGWTPLQSINDLRLRLTEYKDVKLSYAGRLDPLASGLMLVLVGDENKNRDKYLKMEKEYEFEVLFGIRTDTFDLMGIPKKIRVDFELKKLREEVLRMKGKQKQEYPPYSGKTVGGTKLFELAKLGKLPDKMPTLDGEVFDFQVLDISKIDCKRVVSKAIKVIGDVEGDFRQNQIIEAWNNLDIKDDNQFDLVRMRLSCTSGMFVRRVADDLGKKMGGGALAFGIERVRVGKYTKKDCI